VQKLGCLAACASALLAASPAHAGPYTEGEEPEARAEPDKEEKKPKNRLEMGGRAFVRSTVSHVDFEGVEDDPWLADYAVSSARIVADYRRGRRLKVMVEAEFGDDDVKLKDGYVRVRPVRELTIKAGRFKRPMSAIALESAWRLPTVERGILSELEPWSAIELPFGGRGDGLTVAYRARSAASEPEVTIGLFEHDMAENPLDVSEHFGLDPYARFEAEPAPGLTTGASLALVTYQRVNNDRDAIGHAPVGGLDLAYRRGPVEAWLEGFFGKSTVYDATGRVSGRMWAARTLVWLRAKRVMPWLRWVGPYAKASILDPNTGASDDRGVQFGGGINAQFTKFLRLQLEVEQTWIDDVTVLAQQDRLAFYAQLGAAF
jgi:hypothetical protein